VGGVARTWLQIKVELVSGLDAELEPPPGRIFAVAPSVTFERLADAINRAFGRWDFSHLHVFELANGRRIGFPEEDFGDDGEWIDHAATTVGSALTPGECFAFVFDFGDHWVHRCEVLADKLDPREEFGELPREPVILWGWGWLPDQYGREADEDPD
jgi:Plasmid pRiA4b ORF-3-like protein